MATKKKAAASSVAATDSVKVKLSPKKPAPKKPASKPTTTLFWVYPSNNYTAGPHIVFGKPAVLNKDGYHTVEVLKDNVGGELSRPGRRLISAAEYKDFIKAKEA